MQRGQETSTLILSHAPSVAIDHKVKLNSVHLKSFQFLDRCLTRHQVPMQRRRQVMISKARSIPTKMIGEARAAMTRKVSFWSLPAHLFDRLQTISWNSSHLTSVFLHGRYVHVKNGFFLFRSKVKCFLYPFIYINSLLIESRGFWPIGISQWNSTELMSLFSSCEAFYIRSSW